MSSRGFETGIGPMTDNVLNTIINKVSSDQFKATVTDRLVNPVMKEISQKAKPYVHYAIFFYVILLVLLIVIIFMLFRLNKKLGIK